MMEVSHTKIALKDKLYHIEQEIIDQYINDKPNRVWIVGFSGGKDSTLLLQLVWQAIKKLPASERKRPIYVVCNDTLVENPRIVSFIYDTLLKIESAAQQENMPIKVVRTVPKLTDTFWVKLIGLGYPAPNKFFRWCTDRLKINPTTRFIKDVIKATGGAIILLGTRSDESATRAASIKKYEIKSSRLRSHSLPNAYIYAPIKDITTDELWRYLLQVSPPWGGTHRQLAALYKNANGGDCPLVIDTSTPSCGQSRFGCWVCTVVKRDKSMEGLIDTGERWMQPLLEIRDFLVETRDNPEKWRMKKGRDGNEKEGKWGPYKFETRVEILRRLLSAQKELSKVDPNINLISERELAIIQHHWYNDLFFNVKVSDIYKEILQKEFFMSKYDEKLQEELNLLLEICQDAKQVELIKNLLKLYRSKTLYLRKKNILNDFEDLINKSVQVQEEE